MSYFLVTCVKVVFAAEVGGDFLGAEDCLTALRRARCLRPLFSSGPSIDSGVAFPCLFDTSVLCFLSVRHPMPPPRVCACLSVCVCLMPQYLQAEQGIKLHVVLFMAAFF